MENRTHIKVLLILLMLGGYVVISLSNNLKGVENKDYIWVARYNWPHSFSCAARCGKRQISCHNKRYIQSRPRTGEVQTRHEY